MSRGIAAETLSEIVELKYKVKVPTAHVHTYPIPDLWRPYSSLPLFLAKVCKRTRLDLQSKDSCCERRIAGYTIKELQCVPSHSILQWMDTVAIAI